MNTETLLDYIYERQLAKFPDQTREQTERKLRAEILELQEARRNLFFGGSREAVMYEKADVIIMANRLWRDFNDEMAWMILDSMYDYETARYVELKWKIVEQRTYIKDEYGNYQHEDKDGKSE
jgi:hypothetical protein